MKKPQDLLLRKSVKIIDSITDLMLDKFIIAYCDGNLSVLTTEGIPTPKQLQDAWDKIFDEYSDALTSRESKITEGLSKDVVILRTRINTIKLCLFRLSILHSDEIVGELKKWIPIREKFDPSSKEQYRRDLDSVFARCQSRFGIDLKQKVKQLEAAMLGQVEKTDKFHFEKLIVALQRHQGFAINKYTTTVATFVFMLASMIQEAEDRERSQNNKP